MNFFILGLVSFDKATKQKTVDENSFVKNEFNYFKEYRLKLRATLGKRA
jgi:hypothetical protein